MTRRGRVTLVTTGLLGAFLAYELITWVVAYTDDCYVRSDLVSVAPEVTGRIIGLHVEDNATVGEGDPLVTIDPVPFRLVVDQYKAEIAEARAQVAAAQDALVVAQDSADAAASARAYARLTQERKVALTNSGAISQQSIDKANDDLRRAEAAYAAAQAAVAQSKSTISVQQAREATARAELATAEWRLSRTKLVTPTAGAINNLTVRVGDMANENVPLIGIIDAKAWRIIANFKEYYVRRLEVGKPAWVWLDSHPWRLYRARIGGIARGISREQGPDKLLPYVAPTTDWIRLQRRFPVTLYLDESAKDVTLYMGADARVVIFP